MTKLSFAHVENPLFPKKKFHKECILQTYVLGGMIVATFEKHGHTGTEFAIMVVEYNVYRSLSFLFCLEREEWIWQKHSNNGIRHFTLH